MAKVGDQLLQPESGWQRIDDRDSRIKYTNSTSKDTTTNYYNKTVNEIATSGKATFTVHTKRIRIIGYVSSSQGIAELRIDNKTVGTYDCKIGSSNLQILVFDYDIGIKKKVLVDFICSSGTMVCLDAIDIDSDGYISVNIGDQLLQPESGWQRYDDNYYQGIKYSSDWQVKDYEAYGSYGSYGKGGAYSSIGNIQFKFYGSKLRLILFDWKTDKETIFEVEVDGTIYTGKTGIINSVGCVLRFELIDLSRKIHNVVIRPKSLSPYLLRFDAVDIDYDGHICTDNCTLPHNGYFLLKDSLKNLYTIANNKLAKLQSNIINSDNIKTNGFTNLSLLSPFKNSIKGMKLVEYSISQLSPIKFTTPSTSLSSSKNELYTLVEDEEPSFKGVIENDTLKLSWSAIESNCQYRIYNINNQEIIASTNNLYYDCSLSNFIEETTIQLQCLYNGVTISNIETLIVNPTTKTVIADPCTRNNKYFNDTNIVLSETDSSKINIESDVIIDRIYGNTIMDEVQNLYSVGDLYVDGSGSPILDNQGRKQYKIEISTNSTDAFNADNKTSILSTKQLMGNGLESDFIDENGTLNKIFDEIYIDENSIIEIVNLS